MTDSITFSGDKGIRNSVYQYAEFVKMFLDHACSNPSDEHEGYNEYVFEGHCVDYKVVARMVHTASGPQPRGWDILSITVTEN